jgi:DNA repair exonuclease SbcCD nuclease subunit
MKVLLVGDPHLTDNPLDAYRWDVFPQVSAICKQRGIKHVVLMGDAWDRRDRHSAKLLNQSIGALQWLRDDAKVVIYILSGNHDAPLYGGVSYWEFLNQLPDVHYITRPEHVRLGDHHIWLLPFDSNPAEAWKDLALSHARVLLMHQTVAGALVERDYMIAKDSNPMPVLPEDVPVFSGDVHRPQIVGNITYVGVPYQTRFGEDWDCRVIAVDLDKNTGTNIPLENIRRLTFNVTTVDGVFEQLQNAKKNDQLRIRFYINQETFPRWAQIEKDIRDLVKVHEVQLLSLEPIFQQVFQRGSDSVIDKVEALRPEEVMAVFADEEKLSPELLEAGMEIVRETT